VVKLTEPQEMFVNGTIEVGTVLENFVVGAAKRFTPKLVVLGIARDEGVELEEFERFKPISD